MGQDGRIFVSLTGKPMVLSKEMTESTEDLAIFGFEKSFDTDSTQENVYSLVKPAVEAVVMKGVNACVFAYGQTGSGKTYTMYGEKTVEKMGMAQRAIIDIFESLQKAPAATDEMLAEEDEIVSDSESQIDELEMTSQVHVAVYQIYNETVNDLLGKNPRANKTVREDTKRGNFYVDNLTQIPVNSPQKVFKLLHNANQNRASAGTSMNERSSRSHLVLQITVTRPGENNKSVTISKMSIVDLAGSEKVKDSEVSGD